MNKLLVLVPTFGFAISASCLTLPPVKPVEAITERRPAPSVEPIAAFTVIGKRVKAAASILPAVEGDSAAVAAFNAALPQEFRPEVFTANPEVHTVAWQLRQQALAVRAYGPEYEAAWRKYFHVVELAIARAAAVSAAK